MAKIVKLIFLILFMCSTLFATVNYTKELLYFDKKIATSSSNDELLRVYHALKRIYIQSILKNDLSLKKESLKRLVKSAKILGIDSKNYSKELATMEKRGIKSEVSTKQIKQSVQKSSPVLATKKSRDTGLAKLKSIIVAEDRLILNFDKKIIAKDFNSFQLKNKKSFREVFDIRAILPFKPKVKTPKALNDLRVAQFDKRTLRVVLQRESILKSNVVFSGTKIEIFYNSKIKKDVKKPIKLASRNRIIVIDPGHGGRDPGAVAGKGKYEKHAALAISLKAGRILQNRGHRVYYTRTTDKFIKLRDRTRFANKKEADLFLSIHTNAAESSSLQGVETYFLSPARSERSKRVAALENKADIEDMEYFSKQTFLNIFNRAKIVSSNKLAIDIQQGMINRLKGHYKVRDGGVREAPFWVLVGAQMPAVLIEVGYISNPIEKKRIFSAHYQNLIAKGIADGVNSYFIKNE